MYKCENQTQRECDDNAGDNFLMNVNFAGSTNNIADLAKVFEADACQLGRSSRLSSGRFTRTQLTSVTKIKSANFTRVDRTTVITTRRWSGPRMDSFSINQDRHGVASFDLLNLMPTDSDRVKWIGDADALIKEDYFGIAQESKSSSAKESAPSESDNASAPTVLPPIHTSVESAEQENRPDKKVSTRRTVNLTVTHGAILSDFAQGVTQ